MPTQMSHLTTPLPSKTHLPHSQKKKKAQYSQTKASKRRNTAPGLIPSQFRRPRWSQRPCPPVSIPPFPQYLACQGAKGTAKGGKKSKPTSAWLWLGRGHDSSASFVNRSPLFCSRQPLFHPYPIDFHPFLVLAPGRFVWAFLSDKL